MGLNSIDDVDPIETQEWLEALQAVKYHAGAERANFILQLLNDAAGIDVNAAPAFNTPYINTIPVEQEAPFPGDFDLERRIRALMRWNAVAIVVRASKNDLDLGGHIGTFASAATLYDVGYNHFWRGGVDGDMVFFQGHSSPGMYARSYLEGRISEEQLVNFRQEVNGNGLSSYPHPWLMPEYWQFPTVSMGLGPIQAIFQAKMQHYLIARGLIPDSDRKIWCFCGDGEMDEPESLGAITVASREKLDNLIFVINCNLQRLDGPVRGNYKIIQELESVFRGAGWNVIKVIWSAHWDDLLKKDTTGLLRKRMMEAVDGEYQNYAAKDGAYIRANFFGKYPELLQMVEHLTDEELVHMQRGGHDARKVFAAYHAAVHHKGQPTVILTKTVKGYGLGAAGEGLNTAHNTKKMSHEQLLYFRNRFQLPFTDAHVDEVRFYRPEDSSEEMKYLQARRAALNGYIPSRRMQADAVLTTPALEEFSASFTGSADREISTTMAFVRILTQLCKDKNIGPYVVPIIPDEARTFGMEGLFRQFGIYSPEGQLYTPVDSEQVMFYKEARDGQMLQEGLNEAGAFCSWLAAATSYSTHNRIMIPFYIYYSMFGFQRIGDLAWAAGDSRARGFLMGATSGRTTLNGEGLQHEDGHSHIMAGLIPNCVSYDPTFNFELAVIIQDGLRRMVANQEDVFYYITIMNENYAHPAMPEGAVEGILKGLYKLQPAVSTERLRVQLLGSGTILREVMAAAELLAQDFNVAADVWSATSFNLLAQDGLEIDRWNLMHPEAKPKLPYITQCLKDTAGPVIAATDYVKAYADQVRKYVPHHYTVLGTNGFGRSDSRAMLRHFFEVDRYYIVVAALHALAEIGEIKASVVTSAIKQYNLDPERLIQEHTSMLEKILVPDIGDYAEVAIIEIAVKVGDTIKVDSDLITLETDKASMEIPSPKAGVVKEMLVKVGDKVSKGSEILVLEVGASAGASSAAPVAAATNSAAPAAAPAAPKPVTPVKTTAPIALPSQSNVYAGPSVRRYARELGVDLNKVNGSGRKERIVTDDVQNYVRQALQSGSGNGGLQIAPAQDIDFTQFGSIEKQALSRIQKISGSFLLRNWVTIPHVTQFDEADITELELFRKGQKDIAEQKGVKLTPVVFLMKAVVAGLKQFPKFNSSLAANGEELVLKKYFHIGVAVDTPVGLVVPVIRNVDQKGLFELAAELAAVSKKARDGKLTAADMQGGCFTISSLGGIGGTAFTPIINAPEVAILGVSKSQTKPIYDGDNFNARLILPLSLSYDHRVIDGADAVRFTSFLVNLLADIRRLLL